MVFPLTCIEKIISANLLLNRRFYLIQYFINILIFVLALASYLGSIPLIFCGLSQP